MIKSLGVLAALLGLGSGAGALEIPAEAALQDGEIALSGLVVPAPPNLRGEPTRVWFKASAFTLPNGKTGPIEPPKLKLAQWNILPVLWRKGQKVAALDRSDLLPRQNLVFIGKDGGAGQPLVARALLLPPLAEVAPPQPDAARLPSSPQPIFQTPHVTTVMALAFSPDGERIASADFEGDLKVWNRATGEIEQAISNRQGNLRRLWWSKDGQSLLAASIWGRLRCFSWKSGQKTAEFGPSAIRTATLSADGKTVVSPTSQGVQFLDATTGALQTTTPRLNSNSNIALSPDGTLLAAAYWESAQIFDAKTGALVRTLLEKGAQANEVAFSPDGLWLALGRQDALELREVATGTLKFSWPGRFTAFAFAPNAKTLAFGSNGRLTLHAIAPGGVHATLGENTSGQLQCLTFSADGSRLAASTGINFTIWNVQDGKAEVWKNPHTHGNQIAPAMAAWAPDGKRFAIASTASWSGNGAAFGWNLAPLGPAFNFSHESRGASRAIYTSDGKKIALAGGQNFQVFETETGTFVGASQAGYSSNALRWSPDNARIAIQDKDSGHLSIWTAAPFKALSNFEASNAGALGWADNETLLTTTVSPAEGGYHTHLSKRSVTNRRAKAVKGARLEAGLAESDEGMAPELISTRAFSPDNTRVLGVVYRSRTLAEARLWNAEDGKKLWAAPLPSGEIHSLKWSQDAKKIAIATSLRVDIFDATTGAISGSLPTDFGTARDLAWSPDGARLLTAQSDGSWRFWDASSKRLLLSLWLVTAPTIYAPTTYPPPPVPPKGELPEWIALTPDNFYAASPKALEWLRWREGDVLKPGDAFKNRERPDLVQAALAGQK